MLPLETGNSPQISMRINPSTTTVYEPRREPVAMVNEVT